MENRRKDAGRRRGKRRERKNEVSCRIEPLKVARRVVINCRRLAPDRVPGIWRGGMSCGGLGISSTIGKFLPVEQINSAKNKDDSG